MKMNRRDFAATAAWMTVALAMKPLAVLAKTASADLSKQLAPIEARLAARLGVVAIDTGSDRSWGYRADELFAMCSTFKAMACAAVLARVDQGQEDLQRRITYTRDDLVTYSPVTEKHVGPTGMSLAELCDATVTLSDNSAGNFILRALGGPSGLTAFFRSIGDDVSRLDRWELELNESRPGDPRDTTTPAAMAQNLRRLVLGDALSATSRAQLTEWLVANKTGDKRIRAGVPKGWRVGDKTGTGDNGSANDIAVIWPAETAPIVLAIYITETQAPLDDRNAAMAEIARIVLAAAGAR